MQRPYSHLDGREKKYYRVRQTGSLHHRRMQHAVQAAVREEALKGEEVW
jgi:predicted GIY-YIG superfamily endonuclease